MKSRKLHVRWGASTQASIAASEMFTRPATIDLFEAFFNAVQGYTHGNAARAYRGLEAKTRPAESSFHRMSQPLTGLFESPVANGVRITEKSCNKWLAIACNFNIDKAEIFAGARRSPANLNIIRTNLIKHLASLESGLILHK